MNLNTISALEIDIDLINEIESILSIKNKKTKELHITEELLSLLAIKI